MIAEQLQKIKSFGSTMESTVTPEDITGKEAEPDMLKKGGLLERHLSPITGITDRIAEGNTRQLYQAMDGQAVGLYDREEQTFWFMTKEESEMERLEERLGYEIVLS